MVESLQWEELGPVSLDVPFFVNYHGRLYPISLGTEGEWMGK